jgi:S-disulfanyl-L-cysteine oxidoreductase SoxD
MMRVFRRGPHICTRAWLAGAFFVLGAAWMAAASPAAVYTAAQADAGQVAYAATCARCHGRAMQGGVEEPPVSGARFRAKWRNRTTHDLLNFIQTRMPPQEPGGLGEEVNLQIVAHLLRSNGAPSGTEPLSSATDIAIGTLVPDEPPEPAAPEK